MKARMLLLTAALCFAGTALSFAQSPQMGTWKLNEAKSKIPAGMVKNSTVIYAADGDNVKVTTDGTGGDGKPMHTEWTGKFDGKIFAHRRPHCRFAVVQNGQRTRVGDSQQEKRQRDEQGQGGRVQGRQDPHPAHDRKRCGRQEGLRRLNVRQAVATSHLSATTARRCRSRERPSAVRRPAPPRSNTESSHLTVAHHMRRASHPFSR